MDIRTFEFVGVTRKGDFMVNVRAFNKPQARRKFFSQFSIKHDGPVIKKIREIK